ncbi:nucleotidyl transferase AbiEii/AbiGii toxin family protein [Candidatus Shapirobacteria bacterium]|nr:nucleotidyl transferase AbiEii/AbiGii toxin family protein [Candidatus Shapirobacteria bacterium]
MSAIYLEILDKSRREAFGKLKEFSKGYLAGGTALALQINHRLSFDFDLFFTHPLRKSLIRKCLQLFEEESRIIRQTGDQITIITPLGIKLDFIHYWHKPIRPLVKTGELPLASILDIAADKAACVGRRAVWRDYVDIFFLLKKQLVSLKQLIKLAQEKFGGEFNELLFLEQLIFFKDLPVAKTEFLQEKYSSIEIKKYLKKEVKQYLKEISFLHPRGGP